MPLVRYVARSFIGRMPPMVDRADLESAGHLGLIDAVDKFDPERGIPFEGYALQRIRGAVLDSLRADDWAPRSVRAKARKLAAAREELSIELGRDATETELAAHLQTDVSDVRRTDFDTAQTSQSRLEVDEGSESTTVDRIDIRTLNGDLGMELEEVGIRLAHRLAQLDAQLRTVAVLTILEGMSLAQAGAELGVSESRMCFLSPKMLRALVT